MNNRFFYGFATALCVLALIGCSSILKENQGVFGKSSKKTAEVGAKIRQTENMTAHANEQRLSSIGAWAEGTQYSLEKIKTNTPPEVTVAKEINDRVKALADKPNFKEVEEVKAIVDNLLSQIEKEKQAGAKALAAKDKEITKLQESMGEITNAREQEIANALAQANLNAQAADQYKATLNQMDAWFGLGAVFYGLKKFVISSLWILGIGGIIFLLLRAFAATNPVVGAIFAIFEHIFSWVINTVRVIAPKATSVAGLVPIQAFNGYKSTLYKIIDAIEVVKERQSAAVKAGATPNSTIDEIMAEASKSMNQDDKDRVNEAKKELMWK